MSAIRPYAKLVGLAGILAGAAVLTRATPLGEALSVEGLQEWRGTLRDSMWAPVLFVAFYATATAIALPGSILTIAGGAVFGFWWGAVLNSVAANIGASAAFLLSRALGREGIERLAGRRLAGLDRATARHGFAGLFVLRLVPLVPFNALNFGAGLTAMRWRDYALATVIGILPGTLVYTFFADALVTGSANASREASTRLWIAVGLFLMLSAIPIIARRLGFDPTAKDSAEAG